MQKLLAQYRARLPFHSQCPRCQETYAQGHDRCTRCGFRLLIEPRLFRSARVIVAWAYVVPPALFIFSLNWALLAFALYEFKSHYGIRLWVNMPAMVDLALPPLISLGALSLLLPTWYAVILKAVNTKVRTRKQVQNPACECSICRCAFKKRDKFCTVCGNRLKAQPKRARRTRNLALLVAFFCSLPLSAMFFPWVIAFCIHPEGFLNPGAPHREVTNPFFEECLWWLSGVLTVMLFQSFYFYAIFLRETDEPVLTRPLKSA